MSQHGAHQKKQKPASPATAPSFSNLLPPYGPHQYRWIAIIACVLLFFTVTASKNSKPTKLFTELAKSKINISILVEDRIANKDVNPNLAKFEPETGCYLGAYIDLAEEITQNYNDMTGKTRKYPFEFEQKVGKPHAMYFFYLGYGRPLPLDWIRYLTSQGKLVHIALEPNGGLDEVQENDYLNQLADDLRLSGALVFMRFASEMNGTWVNYHGDSKLYKEKWRLVYNVMKERAPNVAMVWCPYAVPTATIEHYYPGDDYVDWVGVNMYNVSYLNQDPKFPATHIKPADLLSFVYNKYSSRKPIMICEYGTTHYSALENEFLQDFAITNLNSLYGNLKTDFPKVKAINYFNVNNMNLAHRMNNNYSVTHDEKVLETYRNVISDPYFISSFFGQKVGGELSLPKPLESGAIIKGRKRFLIYVENGNPNDSVRLKIDEKIIRRGDGVGEWAMTIDFDQFSPGAHYLKIEAIGANGNIVAQKLVPITIEPSGLSK